MAPVNESVPGAWIFACDRHRLHQRAICTSYANSARASRGHGGTVHGSVESQYYPVPKSIHNY